MNNYDQHQHINSTSAYRVVVRNTRFLQASIRRTLQDRRGSMTDRELCEALREERFVLTPRISEMLRDGQLVEDRNVTCKTTGHRVRTVRLATAAERAAHQLAAMAKLTEKAASSLRVWVVRSGLPGDRGGCYLKEQRAHEAYDELIGECGAAQMYTGILKLIEQEAPQPAFRKLLPD